MKRELNPSQLNLSKFEDVVSYAENYWGYTKDTDEFEQILMTYGFCRCGRSWRHAWTHTSFPLIISGGILLVGTSIFATKLARQRQSW